MSIDVREIPHQQDQTTSAPKTEDINQHGPQGMESFLQKVIRHLREGAFDIKTLHHGVEYLGKWLESQGLSQSTVDVLSTEFDYGGLRGCKRVCYGFVKKRSVLHIENQERARQTIFFLDFPRNVTVDETTYSGDHFGVDAIEGIKRMELDPNIVGLFIGPTRISKIPNNGFFDRNFPEQNPFMDTNPPGGRRGAIAIKDNGEALLLTDEEKWNIVRDNFAGYRLVSGTSFYFTSEDDGGEQEIQQTVNKSVVSYLIQYVNAEGETQWSFCLFNLLIPRLLALLVIKKHMSGVNAQSYKAVELEYIGGNCAVRSTTNSFLDIQQYPEFYFQNRSDHYFLKRVTK